jgi:hypothetical protein
MKGQYTHYILLPVAKLSLKAKSIRYNWETYTYKDVEKTGTKKVDKYAPPKDSNTKAEIKAYMDDAGLDYSSGDTKAELLYIVDSTPHQVPQIDEEYTYTESEVDVTTVNKPSWQEYIDRHSNYVAARYSPDKSEVLLKSDFTMTELKEAEGVDGVSVFNNEEARTYMLENWSE